MGFLWETLIWEGKGSYGKPFFNLTQIIPAPPGCSLPSRGKQENLSKPRFNLSPIITSRIPCFSFQIALGSGPAQGRREDSREWHSLAEDVLQGICSSAQRLLLPHHLGHDGILPVVVEDHCGLRDNTAKIK